MNQQSDKVEDLGALGKRMGYRKKFGPKRGKGTLVTKVQTRKAARKQKRKDKKAGRHQFSLAKSGKPQVENDGNKGEKKNNTNKNKNSKKGVNNTAATLHIQKSQPDAAAVLKKEEDELKKDMEEIRRKRLLEDNEEEEKYINQLHKKLKLNKKAAIPASFRTDGLDYLLEICDTKTSQEKKMIPSDVSESEDSDVNCSGNFTDEENSVSDESINNKEKLKKHTEANASTDETEESNSDLDELSESVISEDEEHPKSKKAKLKNENEYWEDIYGRIRDKNGLVVDQNISDAQMDKSRCASVTGKYVPPMKRENDTKRDKIMKSLKGLLNRLSEGNMHSISQQMEEFYMTNSRNEMNESVLDLFCTSLVRKVNMSERLILEHTMLIAILHANVGTEIGAFFIQNFVETFRRKYDETKDMEDNKELSNLALLISSIYHFKIVDSCLIYDILNFLADTFSAKDVELILILLRSVGFRLRKDDPVSLKSLILTIQQKAAESKSEETSSRVKFMLEIVKAIRNNNMSKIPNYDPSYGEHLLKIFKAYLHKGNYITELKISMKDLLSAETKGRWWIVGSAWTNSETTTNETDAEVATKSVETKFNQKLIAKAKAQGMNTETRKNIFCILMSAEDYLDAFEKLCRLGLKNQLEREIVFVSVYCCLQEKKFNPYYTLILSKFCNLDRKYMLTLQYTLWDRLKDLNNQPENQRKNMSKLLEQLIKERVLQISVLKVLEFAEMDEVKLKFLKAILSGVLLDTDETILQDIFHKVSLSEKLNLFRESLRLFMGHFMLASNVTTCDGKSVTANINQNELEILKARVKCAEKAMSSGRSRVLL